MARRSYNLGGRDAENFQRLQRVDSMEAASDRDAYRAAELARKSEADAHRAAIAEQRLGISQERNDLYKTQQEVEAKNREAQRLVAEAALAAANAKADRTIEVAKQGTGFLRDAVGMDPASPQFDTQFQRMQAGYPLATELPAVKEWLDYHVPLRKGFIERDARKQQEEAERQRAMGAVGSLPVKSVTVDGVTYAEPVEKTVATTEAAKRLAQLEALRMKPALEARDDNSKLIHKDQIDYLDSEINKVKSQMGGPKSLDKESAISILQEAGGDKEKARALARERGFQF